ncbi:MAG: hypothetical protein KJ058_06820 [Thermoanaerobaculia bacterium]|nr:hypothetical protein [Thermoanaerobaculia bacterium]
MLKFLISVGSHEGGHGSQALPQFNMDARPVGTWVHPVGAEPGSVMETNVPAETLGAGPREFSASDAKLLQDEPKRCQAVCDRFKGAMASRRACHADCATCLPGAPSSR